jgi:hypothetical protein
MPGQTYLPIGTVVAGSALAFLPRISIITIPPSFFSEKLLRTTVQCGSATLSISIKTAGANRHPSYILRHTQPQGRLCDLKHSAQLRQGVGAGESLCQSERMKINDKE